MAKACFVPEKETLYRELYAQLDALTEGERHPLPNTANMSALLFGAIPGVSWAGFYWLQGEELMLGAFQGKPACIRIHVGRGVCGTAVSQRRAQLVPDVHAFPGHIACDEASRSEIVIPLIKDGRTLGVLDLDSTELANFDECDRTWLSKLCELLISRCDWTTLL